MYVRPVIQRRHIFSDHFIEVYIFISVVVCAVQEVQHGVAFGTDAERKEENGACPAQLSNDMLSGILVYK